MVDCRICAHDARLAIETAMLEGVSYRNIAKQYGVSPAGLTRHKDHLSRVLADAERAAKQAKQAKRPKQPALAPEPEPAPIVVHAREQQAAQVQHGIDVLAELGKCVARINKLFDACDAWLTDPDDPTRYTLEPRAYELDVVYLEPTPNGFTSRKKKLSELLAATGVATVSHEVKVADPRKLVLDAAGQLKSQLELVVDLMERAHNVQRMQALEAAVVEAIGQVDAATQERILDALRPERLRAAAP